MKWMLMPLRRYADFQGRSRRMEYWMWVLFNVVLQCALLIPLIILALSNPDYEGDSGYYSSSGYERSSDERRDRDYDRSSDRESSSSYDDEDSYSSDRDRDRDADRGRDRDRYGSRDRDRDGSFNFSFYVSVDLLAMAQAAGPVGWVLLGLWALWVLVTLIPNLAVAIRRLHDTDKSGWMLLIGFIPLIGAIVLLVFYFMEGTRGPNRFGPDPKGPPVNQTFA